MRFTDTDMDDFASVLTMMTDLEQNGIVLHHAIFETANEVVFMVTYEDPEYQIEVQPSIPAEDDSVESYLDTEMQKVKLPSQPKTMKNRQVQNAGWPPQGS